MKEYIKPECKLNRFDELMNREAEWATSSRTDFIIFDKNLSFAYQQIETLLNGFHNKISSEAELKEVERIATVSAVNLGIDKNRLLEEIRDPQNNTQSHQDARQAAILYESMRSREMLYMLVRRHFIWSVVDTMRFRITPATMNLRLQIEAIGLIGVMMDEPIIGSNWLRIKTETDGIRFFGDSQRKLKRKLRVLGLEDAYNFSSGHAQHARLGAILRGYDIERKTLSFAEINRSNPFSFFLWNLNLLEVQKIILKALPVLFQEVSSKAWNRSRAEYFETLETLWVSLEARFPDDFEEIRQPLEAIRKHEQKTDEK